MTRLDRIRERLDSGFYDYAAPAATPVDIRDLLAVAEAAKKVMSMAGYKDVVKNSASAELKAALAALDAEEQP